MQNRGVSRNSWQTRGVSRKSNAQATQELEEDQVGETAQEDSPQADEEVEEEAAQEYEEEELDQENTTQEVADACVNDSQEQFYRERARFHEERDRFNAERDRFYEERDRFHEFVKLLLVNENIHRERVAAAVQDMADSHNAYRAGINAVHTIK